MTTCFSRVKHRYTFQWFVHEWQAGRPGKYAIHGYDGLHRLRALPSGAFVFSDIERLQPTQRALASYVRDSIASVVGEDVVLNHPGRSLRRYELLTTLHQHGINEYRAVRASEPRGDLRFPVFVRRADHHDGALTPLLDSHGAVDGALAQLAMMGLEPETLLVIEFCDTRGPDGLIRKYAAQRVGPRIVAAHLFFGDKEWLIKETQVTTEATMREELAFMEENPHAEQLEKIFDLAHLQYGRIDYGMKGDRIQVWEINTNPVLAFPRNRYDASRVPLRQRVCDKYGDAFAELDARAPPGTVAVDMSLEALAGLVADGKLPEGLRIGCDA